MSAPRDTGGLHERADLHFLVPGDLDSRTGGYRYDRRVVDGLRALGRAVEVHALDASFPVPGDAALDAAGRTLASIPDGAVTVIDGLAFGAMPDVAAAHARRLDLVALVHHPLALESGLSEEAAARHHRQETRALGAARRVIVTSGPTAAALADYGVPPDRIRVVRPGVDVAPLATGSAYATFDLLCVATLVPRKDHGTLFEALARLAHLPWRLDCVGSAERDPPHAATLVRHLDTLGLTDRVRLLGEVDEPELEASYAAADLFVLASRHEGYGMVFDEAIAHGLPVVTTEVGVATDVLGAGDEAVDHGDGLDGGSDRAAGHAAGLCVPVGDVAALADALEGLLTDPAALARLHDGAIVARARQRRWDATVAEFEAALDPDDPDDPDGSVDPSKPAPSGDQR